MQLATHRGDAALDIHDVLDHVLEERARQPRQLGSIDPLVHDHDGWLFHLDLRAVILAASGANRPAGLG